MGRRGNGGRGRGEGMLLSFMRERLNVDAQSN